MSSQDKSGQSALTWRSYIGVIYAIIVFQPAIIWTYLATGSLTVIQILGWGTLIIFAELAALSGSRLKLQEAALIYMFSGMAAYFVGPLGLIYASYYKNSPIAESFGIADFVPTFYAPDSLEPWVYRTFFHPSFTFIIITFLIATVGELIASLSICLIFRQQYIKVEKLPFPLVQPVAEACTTLAEMPRDKMEVLTTAAIVSSLYTTLAFGLPTILGAFGYRFNPIPTPWIDMNALIHRVIKGASFGIATDAISFASGFIIPFEVSLSIFLGSFALFFIGNTLLVFLGISQFATEWRIGQNIQQSWVRSTMFFWTSTIIGLAIVAGILPLVRHPKNIIAFFKGLLRRPSSSRKPDLGNGSEYPLWLILIVYLGCTISMTMWIHYLVPDFPISILLLLYIVWPFFHILIITRGAGVGAPFTVPYVREFMIISSGYKGYDIWFAPPYIGGDAVSSYKLLDLTGISIKSYFKTFISLYPVALLISFVFVMAFWSIAPIPSSVYPGAQIFWPLQAAVQSVWVTRPPGIFQPITIAGSAAILTLLYAVTQLLHLPFSPIGFVAGCSTSIPFATTIFLGALTSKIIQRRIGKEVWAKYNAVIFAGVAIGMTVIMVFASTIALIVKSIWIEPY